MSQTSEEQKALQKGYYTRLNEILVKVQDGTISQRDGKNEISSLNDDFPNLNQKASTEIIDAMIDESTTFYEGSLC